MVLSSLWLEIVSELLVNLSAAWFAAVVLETQFESLRGVRDITLLTARFLFGILTLYLAKRSREGSRQ